MTFFSARSPVRSADVAARRTSLLLGAVLAASALLAGCSTYDNSTRKIANAITPYRIDIVQGNFVSREQASQLKEGMTRDQVRYVLGSPLLTDMFHGNRWDYVFSFKRGNTNVVQERKLTVWFEADRLAKWAGADDLPSEVELIAEIDGIKRPKKAAAAAAAGAAPATRAPSIPSAEMSDRVQSSAGAKNAVDVTLPERRTGGGGTDTSVPPPATTSP
ncbi:outer membrane protein assembly factor BamE [Ralstonia pseudosolanacearum]|uniref:outer membrane protein assembly factor BamE n=1 Tax=Ralstonia pseudosolanacearum TaxID=1310165 RepID=UPI000E592113|nr:outer membrane protein assembly factor BamE [Ralstonia pseudosolanacearum]AXV68466.1 cell envelope protein SmpA [Ralstonia solanacearum]AXV94824.1 cell envelope protein SmpA [Ralstonia solanacearum]AXW00036.1 cell envelope protein SmpA [Ralstonia solanacearum]AXW09633.1 cell envelope protein SmpA [Ralstonia solanacearum]AXW27526.1 cell envelope protein SmpA [Ralstonia solanacearum]